MIYFCSTSDYTQASIGRFDDAMSPFFQWFCSLFLIVMMTACSTLPQQQPHPDVYAFEQDTQQTYLGRLILPLRAQQPQLTGYHMLHDPLEALAARLHLIEKAEKTLDLQYYIWDNDKVGALAIQALTEAADRGVQVRLLIDDNNSKAMESVYLALSQHQNIQVKLYNPYRFRNFRALDLVLDLKRMNRRMHNKSFIADHQIALIGGRNMSNQYYHVSDQYQFSDVDVMLVGSATDEIIHSFDEYWNDEYAYRAQDLINAQKHQLRYPELKAQLDEHRQQINVQNYLDLANRSQAVQQWLNEKIAFNWVEATVLKDHPAKIKGNSPKEDYLYYQLGENLLSPQQHLDIISAYFVPEKSGTALLSALSQHNVEVRVLTNSYQANDVPFVHAFYRKYRPELLSNGIALYEFLARTEFDGLNKNNLEISKQAKVSLKSLSRSSLHTKMISVDDKQVFIGSYNLDPRSAYLNTEIGVILNSPQLATAIHESLDNNIHQYAYQVVLNADQRLHWKLTDKQGQISTFTKEPKMKWWQQGFMHVLGWLPIESFM